MTHARWGTAIASLRAQDEAVREARRRVEEFMDTLADDATDLDEHRDRLTTAKAVWQVCEADYLRCATALLRAHLSRDRPPLRRPVAVVWPRPWRHMWRQHAHDRSGGVWRAIPRASLLAQAEAAGHDEVLVDVIEAIRDLQASHHGHRTSPRLYERYIPDRSSRSSLGFSGGRTARTLPGFPNPGHWVNQNFARGDGWRIQPGREGTLRTLEDNERAVHARVEAFGSAVLRLLEHHHGPAAPGRAARLRGAARWIGREQQAVPRLTTWPQKLTAVQGFTLAVLGWLVLVIAAIPWTVGMKARVLTDHPKPILLGAVALAGLGAYGIHRAGPRLMRQSGRTIALTGAAAGVAAYLVMQVQGPVAGYFFAGPFERYEREFSDGCLAASPYRDDAIQSEVAGGTLVIRPISGDTTLRLGPAEDGGTHPLRPQDRGTREVLERYGCQLP
ncbi:hypothetical protein PYK79_27125 [Streptomyces sp. ID05-04B]|uniref:hypothetical protein n=1 Tax=Streptomyces sp. ID05-04B TaxID=3028661 RepID=UPI0029C5B5C2|nr:hypothetical protein [Streptomyces sp. ID05-04B]MDX5566271.1 hypothetical protein [Streptomyces sp. ID05-04B]